MAFHKSVIGFPVIIAVTAYMMAGETSGAFPPTLSDGLEQKIYNCNPAGRHTCDGRYKERWICGKNEDGQLTWQLDKTCTERCKMIQGPGGRSGECADGLPLQGFGDNWACDPELQYRACDPAAPGSNAVKPYYWTCQAVDAGDGKPPRGEWADARVCRDDETDFGDSTRKDDYGLELSCSEKYENGSSVMGDYSIPGVNIDKTGIRCY